MWTCVKVFSFLVLVLNTVACTLFSNEPANQDVGKSKLNQFSDTQSLINSKGRIIATRVLLPKGYERITASTGTFEHYLRHLPLKPSGSPVNYFDGRIKENNRIYEAVIDLEIGKKDLHQCADALMRLRAEYLWNQKAYDQIHFNFTNGFRVEYTEWMKGRRMIVEGNSTKWDDNYAPSNTKKDFWDYMELIFTYAGTASLEKELKPVAFSKMKIGDVLIQGGFPGHAVIVLDMAVNPQNGRKVYLLGQSYMPAQELQVLTNRNNPDISPWYDLNKIGTIKTPEWNFEQQDLMRFD